MQGSGAISGLTRVAHCADKQSLSASKILIASGITKSFGGVRALNGCDVSVGAGEIVGIIGPNGAGKSSLFNVISGVIRPDSGRVMLDGQDITGARPHRVARAGLVRTFQIARELGELTVLENLLLAGPEQTGESIHASLFARRQILREEEAAVAKAKRILLASDLWGLADAPARTLSGGQKKLLELSRALMLDPKVILLDEPTAGVSPLLVRTIRSTILQLSKSGITFLIIEHDMDTVAEVCDPIFVMVGGSVLTSGSYRSVTSDARVRQAYLGGGSA